MERKKLTYQDVFGDNGMLPLRQTCVESNCVCPHCNYVVKNVCFPPPGIIAMHTCPICNNTIIPFSGRLIPLDNEIIKENNDNVAREHIAKCIFVWICPIFIGNILNMGLKLTGRKAGYFLDDCYNVIYEMVGERDEERDFMEKLKKAFLELKRSNAKRENIECVFKYLTNMSNVFNKNHKGPVITDKMIKKLGEINTVEDFLNEF